MRALAYVRVSTDEQVERTSLTVQEEGCRAWCEREGHAVDRVYSEEGVSAKTRERAVLLEMLADCRRRRDEVDCVVVYKLDRLARNRTDHHAIRAMLAGLGIRLASATEALSDDPTGRFLEGMLAAVA